MGKNSGPKSKKELRRQRARARAESFAALTPAQQEERKAFNKQEYHYWHDEEEHLNGGEREFNRAAGLPLDTN